MSTYKVTCDIAVIGAGPSGISAAVAAAVADPSVSVVLCEKEGRVGGMSTSGMLNVWCGACESDFFTKIKAAANIKDPQPGRRSGVYSPHRLERFYMSELERAGVKLLLHSQAYSAVMKENGKDIDRLLLTCSGHTVELCAKLFIDSTGNGDAAYLAGCEYEIDSEPQPMTPQFIVGGVDDSKAVYPTFGTHPELEEKMRRYVDSGIIPPPGGHVILIEGINRGTAHVNMSNASVSGCDPTDPFVLTRAEKTARAQFDGIVRFLQECVPGYENCYIIAVPDNIGVRESRRFIGKTILTEYDIADGITCRDSVADNVRAGLGGHAASGRGASGAPLKAKPFSIPYGCCVPDKGGNIRFNGRCISVTHAALSAVRLMPVCICIGERLGRIAAAEVRESDQI